MLGSRKEDRKALSLSHLIFRSDSPRLEWGEVYMAIQNKKTKTKTLNSASVVFPAVISLSCRNMLWCWPPKQQNQVLHTMGKLSLRFNWKLASSSQKNPTSLWFLPFRKDSLTELMVKPLMLSPYFRPENTWPVTTSHGTVLSTPVKRHRNHLG